MVKNPPANTGDAASIPGSGRSPGGGNGSPLQYSCLENPTDRGAWQATSMGSQRVGHSQATEHSKHILNSPVCPGPWLFSGSGHDLAHFFHLGHHLSSDYREQQRLPHLDADLYTGAQQHIQWCHLWVHFFLHGPEPGLPAHPRVTGPCLP